MARQLLSVIVYVSAALVLVPIQDATAADATTSVEVAYNPSETIHQGAMECGPAAIFNCLVTY